MLGGFLLDNMSTTQHLVAWHEAKPLFNHDCSKCFYLGDSNGADLYACVPTYNNAAAGFPNEHFIETLIARFSSEDGDYASGTEFAFLGNLHLAIALKRALAWNFKIKPEVG